MEKCVKTGRFIQMVSSSEVIIIKFAEFVIGKHLKSRFGSWNLMFITKQMIVSSREVYLTIKICWR